jgi:hypothetical protein
VLYHLFEDFYDYRSMESYNNILQAYTHNQFKIFFKIFSLEIDVGYFIEKCSLNDEGNRLVVLFSNSEIKKNKICIYNITLLGKNLQELKINFLY